MSGLSQISIVTLRVPVLTLILAATAIPVGFRPLSQLDLDLFSYNANDIVENVAGFVPVGIVLAALGPVRAVMVAALLSMFAETSQLVMLFRAPSLVDIATNIVGAIFGVIVVARYNLKPQFKNSRQIGIVSAALSLLLILGVWVWKRSGDWTTTPGTGALEAHWRFDESSGGIALDSSGHGLNGEYHNEPKRVAGPMGSTVKFDGTSDYVDFGHLPALRLTSSMTISAWIRPASFPHDDAAIVSNHTAAMGFQLDTTIDSGPRTIGFKLGNSCGTIMARYGATPLALDIWYYVAGVYNAEAKTLDVYLNGELDNGSRSGPVTGSQISSRGNVYVGRRGDPGFSFAGEIGDVRIYSVPLTKAEIAADMHVSPQSSAPQPVAGVDYASTPSPSQDRKGDCYGSPDPEDRKMPSVAAMLGVLVSIACAGLVPSSGPLPCLIASLVAGLLFVPVTASLLTGWMMPLLSLAGGVSVAFTMRTMRR